MASKSNLNRVKSLRKELEEKNLKLKEMDKTICEMQVKWLQENNHLKDEIDLNGYVEEVRRLIQQGECLIKEQVNHLNHSKDEIEALNGDVEDSLKHVEDCLKYVEGSLKLIEDCLKDVECLNKGLDEKIQQLKKFWVFRSILNYFAIGFWIWIALGMAYSLSYVFW